MFSTESCCDYMHVYEGADDRAPRIASFSGRRSDVSAQTEGSQMFVAFGSDGSVNAAGFQCEFIIEGWRKGCENLTFRKFYYFA